MVILGLDPGLGRCGYGVVDTNASEKFVRCGMLTTPKYQEEADRLTTLAGDLQTLIDEVRPDTAVVEHIFFGTNAKTAIMTAQARGVLIYVLRRNMIPVESLTPLQIKSRLTGYGSAPKEQIQSVVASQLKLSHTPKPDDAADALAAALCVA